MPGGVSIKGRVVVQHCSPVPVTVPSVPSPGAAHQRANANSCAEANRVRGGYVARGVPGPRVRRAVDDGGVVFRHVDDLRVRRHDVDQPRTRFRHRELGRGFQRARCLGLRPQRLHSLHHVRRLIVIGLAERRSPAQVLRHVVEDGWKRGQRLHARVPRLVVDGLDQR